MYIDWGLSWLYSVPPGKFRHSIINQSMTTSFQILPKVSSRYLYTHLVTSDIWTGTSDNLFTKDNRDSRVRGDTGQDTTAKPCRITWDSTVMSHFQNLTGFPLKYALNCVTQWCYSCGKYTANEKTWMCFSTSYCRTSCHSPGDFKNYPCMNIWSLTVFSEVTSGYRCEEIHTRPVMFFDVPQTRCWFINVCKLIYTFFRPISFFTHTESKEQTRA